MMRQTFLPERTTMEEVLANSYRDFHVKGFDYICLRRSPRETIKLYFFDGDVAKLPEVVNPHDHRYDFDTLCIAGGVENVIYAPTCDPLKGKPFERFHYMTPLNGGDGFRWAGTERLIEARRTIYRPMQIYWMPFKGIHTIRMAEPETVIALRQFDDMVPASIATTTWSRDREPPDLAGLYRRFTADEVRDRLRVLANLAPRIQLPEII